MKTILILYENTGAGHKRAAAIIEAMLASCEWCRIVTSAGSKFFDAPVIDVINHLWIHLIRRNWINLADSLINFFLRGWIAPVLDVIEVDKCHQKLDELAPDAIVCTADGFGKMLGLYARKRGIPLYIVITDITTFSDVVTPIATHICFFPETIRAIRSYDFNTAYFSSHVEFSKPAWKKMKYVLQVVCDRWKAGGARSIYRNIDRDHIERNQAKCVAIGPLVASAYYEPRNKADSRQKLGIDINQPCALIISGSIGGGFLYDMIAALQKWWKEPLTLLVVCGRDEASYLQLVKKFEKTTGNIVMKPFGFVDKMEELYASADVVIARPSASVFLEAMTQRVPILSPEKAAANDIGSVVLVKKYCLGEVYLEEPGMADALRKIIKMHDHYVDCINRFLSVYPSNFDSLKKQLIEIILPVNVNR
jgi:UDP-N-acetylglucosamine:LPS N-acetylglucosamine transferase